MINTCPPQTVFPAPGQISVKGKAPLLVPHPGDNMTPMSDQAVTKQARLRGLRREMLQVGSPDTAGSLLSLTGVITTSHRTAPWPGDIWLQVTRR